MEYFSQIGQDQYYIEHIINSKRGGRFLDVGAHDGIRTSNTYALEKYLGWTGICIEANTALVEECRQNRPGSQVIEAAVWSEEKTVIFEHPHSGNDFLSRIGGLAINDNYFPNDFTSTIDVQMVAKPLKDLIGSGEQYFDYFSLDIEGAELEALKGIDWNQTSFGYIAIEYGHRELFKKEIEVFMKTCGYTLHRVNDFDIDFIPFQK